MTYQQKLHIFVQGSLSNLEALSSTLGRPGAPPRSDPAKLHAINVSQLLNCEDSIRLH